MSRGIDWNKSPIVEFKTSAYNKMVSKDDAPPPEAIEGVSEVEEEAAGEPNSLSSKELHENLVDSEVNSNYGTDEFRVAGMSIEYFVGLVVLGLIAILVFVGIVYKVATRRRGKARTRAETGGRAGGEN